MRFCLKLPSKVLVILVLVVMVILWVGVLPEDVAVRFRPLDLDWLELIPRSIGTTEFGY
jgi:hypothetical protein